VPDPKVLLQGRRVRCPIRTNHEPIDPLLHILVAGRDALMAAAVRASAQNELLFAAMYSGSPARCKPLINHSLSLE